jgi:hypothetical protein
MLNNARKYGSRSVLKRFATKRPSLVVRDYLNLHLNSGDQSYFVQNAPVHSSDPLKFGEMWGETDYRKAVWNQYQCANGFITPVEIFKPYYAISLAKHMIATLRSSFGDNYLSLFTTEKPLIICEIGGGNGNCLKGILDYFKGHHPDLFTVLCCISIDVSPEFVKLQQTNLQDYREKVKFVNKSIFEIHEQDLGVADNYAFVVGLELLDNLPHDKLIMSPDSRMLQVVVEEKEIECKAKYVEEHVPVSDVVIVEFLETIAEIVGVRKDCFTKTNFKVEKEHLDTLKELHLLWNYFSGSSRRDWSLYKRFLYLIANIKYRILPLYDSNTNIVTYIPTGSYLFLKFIKRFFPKHYLILSDFNAIQGSGVGVNAPLVQRIVGNTVLEKSSYLDAPLGTFDVFFPTNFPLLSHVYQKVMQTETKAVTVVSTKSFMKSNSDYKLTRTRLGYNPLLEDFSNTSFLLGNRFVE